MIPNPPALAQTPLNKHLLSIAVIASAGGLLFGFDTAVIAGTTTALTAVYGLNAFTLGNAHLVSLTSLPRCRPLRLRVSFCAGSWFNKRSAPEWSAPVRPAIHLLLLGNSFISPQNLWSVARVQGEVWSRRLVRANVSLSSEVVSRPISLDMGMHCTCELCVGHPTGLLGFSSSFRARTKLLAVVGI